MTTTRSPWAHALATSVALIAWTWASEASATVVTSGCASANQFCTVEELVGGANMLINDKFFDHWTVDDASTVAPVDLSRITVMPLDDQVLNPGLAFLANGALITGGFDQIDLDLAFRVSVVGGAPRIVGSSLELTAYEFSAGNAGGLIAVASDLLAANGTDILGEQEVFAMLSLDAVLFDSIVYASQAAVLVETNILVTGDDTLDTVALNSFTQRFSQRALQVPEPPVAPILGLALLGLWRRRRHSPR